MMLSPSDGSPAVHAAGLTFGYPSGVTLFRDLSLSVHPTQVLCVTGQSGTGKSTLLLCLAGILPADGEVQLQGQALPASAAARARLRLRSCGLVFQRGELLPELTVLENASLPLRLLGVPRRAADAKASELLERLDVVECARRSPGEISGGQAQRVSLARALVHDPAVVLADEPTASLDSTSRRVVMETLRSAAAHGAAVVCATHDAALTQAATDVLCLDVHHEQTRDA